MTMSLGAAAEKIIVTCRLVAVCERSSSKTACKLLLPVGAQADSNGFLPAHPQLAPVVIDTHRPEVRLAGERPAHVAHDAALAGPIRLMPLGDSGVEGIGGAIRITRLATQHHPVMVYQASAGTSRARWLTFVVAITTECPAPMS